MISEMVDRIPPIVKTVLMATAIGTLTMAVGNWIDAYLVDSALRVPILLILGWLGMTAAWFIPLTFRIWEAMEADNGTEE
jgi:hypothetical protein